VVEAIASFEGRSRAHTLPENADARYLLGIAKNIAIEREAWEIAIALWEERVAARDRIAVDMKDTQTLLAITHQEPQRLITAYVDQALKNQSRIEAFFWLTATADVITEQHDRSASFKLAARRISATMRAPHRQRIAALRFLAAKVLPIR
jgi:hypothetical protein